MDKPRNSAPLQGGLRAKWSDAGHLRSEFATEMNVVHVGGQVVLTFGEVRLPILTEPVASDVDAEVRPVVRLVVPEQALEGMVKALASVSERIKQKPTK